jgi:thiamine-monophosphate kinase
MSGLGEFEIIERFFTRLDRRRDVVRGVGDDAAVLDVPADHYLVAAVDTIVEGVHFPADLAAEHVGWRSLAVNLSDLAAMGAKPSWATLSLSMPAANEDWLAGFAAGLAELARAFDVALVGGDTVQGPLVITVEALGFVERDRHLTRSGAVVGDLLYVSGTPGEAAAGLELLSTHAGHDPADDLVMRFSRPQPRIELGRKLRGIATAAMDVSDGLLADLGKLCAASGCGAELDLARLPLSDTLVRRFGSERAENFALCGGDDYELLFTLPADSGARFGVQTDLPVSCTQIGRIVPGTDVTCRRDGARVMVKSAGFDHFRRDAGS